MSFNSAAIRAFVLMVLGVLVYPAEAVIWTDPCSFVINIKEGCTQTDTLTVGNTGPGSRNFTVRTHIVSGSGGQLVGIDRLSTPAAAVTSTGSQTSNFAVRSDVPYSPDELIVRFAPKSDRIQLNSQEKDGVINNSLAGAKLKREFKIVPGLSVVKLPAGLSVEKAVQKLSKNSGILYAHPNYQVQAFSTFPNDPRFSELWGMHNMGQTGGTIGADIKAPEAWDIGSGSRDIVVAVIDTGVDYTHPDLAANMWVNEAELHGLPGVDDDHNGFVDDIYGYDFVNNDGNPMDDHFHGTHCAGTIGAVGNNGIGVAGVCWNVKIMALKFLNSGGSGTTEDAIRAVEYSVLMGANLSSNSWGGGGNDQGLKDAIDAAGAAGMLFVAAAGNDGTNNDTDPHYPSSYDSPSIVAVMATDKYDAKSSFSCYGLTSVDIGAPGSSILSCQPGGGYQLLSGTSMATPHVAGACALLWSLNPGLSNSEVKDILLRTVDPTLSGLCVSGGRLNLYKAVCETKVPWIDIEPNSGTIGAGGSINLNVTFDAMDLAPGIYGAEIVINSNDPCNPAMAIPVTMTVSADALQVSPSDNFDSNGTQGGPFVPACKTYTLTNNGSSPVSWTTLEYQNWLTVTPSQGSIEPGSSVDVNVCINAGANQLDPNVYSQVLTFQNTDSGSIKTRSISLTVNPPDLFTESFDTGGNFKGISLTLRPNGSIACYEACRDNAAGFPTDPNGGTYLSLGDDDYAQVVLTGGKQVLFYNQSYDRFYVGSNGYITFGTADTGFSGSLEDHFALPRISGYFTDLTPANAQSISFKQLEDRVAVTFNGVPIFGDKTTKISFQIELFFGDGSIRITWLKLAAVAGVAGLSEGYGLPEELFKQSDFRAYPICWPMCDYNKDYTVDLADLAIFVSHWLDENCDYPLWCDRTDLDYSSFVDGVDFSAFALNWGITKSTMPTPISHWKFDEGQGAVAYDSVGDNDGNIYGATWTTGQINGALNFDGVNDYVNVPNNSSQQIATNQITLSAWIKLTADIGNTQKRIICKQQTGYIAWGFEVYGNGFVGATGNQLVFHDSSGTSWYECMSQTHLVTGQWYHVAVTDNAGQIRIYINGSLDKSSNSGYGIPTLISAPINIGKTNPDSTFYFNGKIDDVRFYDVALSAEQILRLYQEGQSKKAINPNPADDQTFVDPNAVLNWLPGKDALTHDVYFGTSFNEVNDADIYDANVYMGNQDVNHWDVRNHDSNGLEPDTAFYWRIDEVGNSETTKGDVWAFRTSVAPGLVGWWKFDEGTGTIAYDSAGDRNGTVNGASWTTGQIEGALNFDGVNDYVWLPNNNPIWLPQNDFTASAWVNFNADPVSTKNEYIFGFDFTWYQNHDGQAGVALMRYGTNGKAGFYVETTNTDEVLPSNDILVKNRWYHVVVVRQGTTQSIYLDGILNASRSCSADPIKYSCSCNDDKVNIGRYSESCWSNPPHYLGGKIDDVRIYNQALSADEILQLYREGQSKKAINPNPADGQTFVDPNAVLNWLPGKDALTHDVYFGTSFNEVNDADIYDANVYMGNQDVNHWDANNFDSNGLEPNTLFYWRIDEVGAGGTIKGDVWGFRTVVTGYDPTLIAWWKLDEGTGTTAYDSADNHNGQLVNGPVWATGKINGGLSFDGVNDYVSVADDASLRFTKDSSFTICAWVKPNSTTYAGQIVCKMQSNSQHGLFTYELQWSPVNLRFDFVLSNSGNYYIDVSTPNGSVPTGGWAYATCVYQNKDIKIYLNGALKSSGYFNSNPSGAADKFLSIGVRTYDTTFENYLGGMLDDVRIYNRALSADEIWQLYQGGL
jgi:subtilisin family serine protease